MKQKLTEAFIEIFLKSKKFRNEDIKAIIKHYNEDFRKYHNIDHISDLIFHLTNEPNDEYSYIRLDNENDFELIVLAIIFHDVIYTVGSKTNETDSARFFIDSAKNTTLTNNEIIAVANLILTTKDHRPYQFFYPNYNLRKLSTIMIELDLKGFEVDDYFKYEILVQEEFRTKYTWEEYKESHIKFLEAYKDRVSDKAKKNMDYLIDYCKNATHYYNK